MCRTRNGARRRRTRRNKKKAEDDEEEREVMRRKSILGRPMLMLLKCCTEFGAAVPSVSYLNRLSRGGTRLQCLLCPT
jgi:hypothetical protein